MGVCEPFVVVMPFGDWKWRLFRVFFVLVLQLAGVVLYTKDWRCVRGRRYVMCRCGGSQSEWEG